MVKGTPIHQFDFALPEELIAQYSAIPRDISRLLLLDRKTGTVEHRLQFSEIEDALNPGDVLVFNNSKVFKARVSARKRGGSIDYEVFILRPRKEGWETMMYPGRRVAPGMIFDFADDLSALVVEKRDNGTVILDFSRNDEEVMQFCEKHGSIPVPPYVKKAPERLEDYQTVYAKRVGSVAAPTAGFHFTGPLLKRLKEKGVQMEYVTLHIGLGTFQPIWTDTLEEHVMHEEFVDIAPDVAERLFAAKQEGRRIIAVGTTVTRALEGASPLSSEGFSGDVQIFIKPGYTFQMIDALITNFHLPRTTLLGLVCAFGGYENVMKAYQEAVKERYRFYSFGDAMFIQ